MLTTRVWIARDQLEPGGVLVTSVHGVCTVHCTPSTLAGHLRQVHFQASCRWSCTRLVVGLQHARCRLAVWRMPMAARRRGRHIHTYTHTDSHTATHTYCSYSHTHTAVASHKQCHTQGHTQCHTHTHTYSATRAYRATECCSYGYQTV